MTSNSPVPEKTPAPTPRRPVPVPRRDAGAIATSERNAALDRAVPWPVQVAAGWSWRALVIGVAVVAVGWVLTHFRDVTIPFAVALLLAALLQPLIGRLTRWGWPRGLAVALGLVGGLLVVVGVLTLIVWQIVDRSKELADSTVAGFEQLLAWLSQGPLGITQDQIDGWIAQLTQIVSQSQSVIAGYAAAAGASVGNFFAGLAIALFTLFFLLYEGDKIWAFGLRFVPKVAKTRVDVAARTGWRSLIAYVRATVIVAFVDAVGVLVAALILQVPLAPALAALVFIGAFVPIVGALVTGTVAVAVALVTLGWVQALIMLGAIILVMQLEGHFLQPFLLGKAVALHPLAVILGLAVGITIGGIVGGLFAIPVIAFTNTFVGALTRPAAVAASIEPEPDPVGDATLR